MDIGPRAKSSETWLRVSREPRSSGRAECMAQMLSKGSAKGVGRMVWGHPRERPRMMAYRKGKPLSLDVEELLTDLWAGRELKEP